MQPIIEGDLSAILESTEVAILAEGHTALEGPAWHPAGYLTYVDLDLNQLWSWSPQDGAQVIRHPNGEGNGCTLDEYDRLIMCEGDGRRIVRLETDGSWTVVVDNWQGKRLNKPNDIVRHSSGALYFTDPGMFLPEAERDIATSNVWRLTPDGRLDPVSTNLTFPNGLAFSPDEKTLYVANSFLDRHCLEERKRGEVCHHRYLAAYDVEPDGSLSGFRQITDMASNAATVPDGMKVDVNGVIYCTGSGALWILAPDGGVIGKLITPDGARNCAFGDDDLRTLYITALKTVYSIRTTARGIR